MHPPSKTSSRRPVKGPEAGRLLVDAHARTRRAPAGTSTADEMSHVACDGDLDGVDAGAVVIQPEGGQVVARERAGEPPPDREVRDAGQSGRGRDRLGLQHHDVAVGPRTGGHLRGARRCSRPPDDASAASSATVARRRLMRRPPSSRATIADEHQAPSEHRHGERDAAQAPPLDPDRRASRREAPELLDQVAAVVLQHRSELGGARDAPRGGERLGDLVGREVRAARARTRVSASERRPSTSIMLARSTACRHGEGGPARRRRRSACRCPSRTMRLAGLMSRCASPSSHMSRISASPWSMTASSISASPISTAPSKNSITIMYSRSGVISTTPYGRRDRKSGVLHQPQRVVLVLDEAAHRAERASRPPGRRTGSCGRACTSGRPGRGSWRRAWRTGAFARSVVAVAAGLGATRRRSGVDPPEPSRPDRLDLEHLVAQLILHGRARSPRRGARRRRGARSCRAGR